jgi:hypothetical protein
MRGTQSAVGCKDLLDCADDLQTIRKFIRFNFSPDMKPTHNRF